MKKKKIQPGSPITSLDQMYKCEWIIAHGKPYARGWVTSWNLRTAYLYIQRGNIYEGRRLTNGEYYDLLTDGQIRDKFGAELHFMAELENGVIISQELFDARYLDEILPKWKEEPVK